MEVRFSVQITSQPIVTWNLVQLRTTALKLTLAVMIVPYNESQIFAVSRAVNLFKRNVATVLLAPFNLKSRSKLNHFMGNRIVL